MMSRVEAPNRSHEDKAMTSQPPSSELDEVALRESIVHGLRMRGWSRIEAESEALDRIERRRVRTIQLGE